MGSALGTTGLSVLATLAFIAAAILSIVASDRLRSLTGYNSNDTFKAANNNLTLAMILAWVAAGVSLILFLGYVLHSLEVLQTEWLHSVLIVLGIVSGFLALIFLGVAMRKVDNTPNDNGMQNYILWAMIMAGIGVVVLVFMGLWRITHHATKPKMIPSSVTTSESNAYVVSSGASQMQAPIQEAEQPMNV
jgi:uncharacterized membrane protein